jgi:cyclopropane fatty-acyl-phospholipid synthase-like methyltransferase
MPKIEQWEERYSKVKSIEMDTDKYVENKAKKWKQTLDIILNHTPVGGSILETGCGSSAMSVWLNQKGFMNFCIDNNEEILNIAKVLNEKSSTGVSYSYGELTKIPFKNNTFDTIFSQGVLEHFNESEILNIINEGLRVGETYIFAVPTICDMSTCLRGDENLMSYFRWKKVILKSEARIAEVQGYFPFHPIIQKINSYFHNKFYLLTPTLVFVLTKR